MGHCRVHSQDQVCVPNTWCLDGSGSSWVSWHMVLDLTAPTKGLCLWVNTKLLLRKIQTRDILVSHDFYFYFFPSIAEVHSVFYFIIFLNLFIYFWLCWVFVSVWRLSPVAASGGHSSSRCAGLSPSRPLLLLSTGSRRAGSAIAQQLWLTGPVAPRHVGSSQTRARTRVPCIGRQTLNHCATREAQPWLLTLENYWMTGWLYLVLWPN